MIWLASVKAQDAEKNMNTDGLSPRSCNMVFRLTFFILFLGQGGRTQWQMLPKIVANLEQKRLAMLTWPESCLP
jgi:hypothetical protein